MTTTNDGKTKKRPRSSDYYDRLLFQCQKNLHKHAKLAKQFEGAGVAAIIYTDIDRDGVLAGINWPSTIALISSTPR